MEFGTILLLILSLLGLGGANPDVGSVFPPSLEPLPTVEPGFPEIGTPTAVPQPGDQGWITLTVPAGATVSAEPVSAAVDDTLKLQYEVAQHDVRAYVNRPLADGERQRLELCIDESGGPEVLKPDWTRSQECRTSRSSGTLKAAVAGNYWLEFDNSYSWFQSKLIRYRMFVAP